VKPGDNFLNLQASTSNFELYDTSGNLLVKAASTNEVYFLSSGDYFVKVFPVYSTVGFKYGIYYDSFSVGNSPTDLSLSNSSVAENQAVGTSIGTFSSTDPDTGDAFVYSLVTGAGSTDNLLFAIVGNQLQSNGTFDFETKNNYSIRVKTTDQWGLTFEKQLTIGVTNINETPTNLNLSNNTIAENQSVGTAIGTFTSTDPDTGNTFTYSLVTGIGSTDNALFTITGNQLQSNGIFDFETQNSYSIRVRTTDQGGLTFEKQLTIEITDINETPTNLNLSNSTIDENQAIGTAIGTFTSTDPDTGNTFTYSLITGIGDTDNALFAITGNQLQSNGIFDYETQNSYNIRVRTTDQGGLTLEKQLTIGITNVDESSLTPQQDILNYGGLDDTVTGIFANLLQNDNINGGAGIDTLIISEGIASNTITINASSTTNQLNIAGTTVKGFERFDLSGFLGKVTYTGTTANDWVATGAGADVLNGGLGSDTLIGGLGNDTYTVDNAGDIVTETSTLATEIDTVNSSISYTLSVNVERLTLTGTANINGTGNTLANTLTGNIANNILDGGDGNDSLNGGTGIDALIGGLGNDTYTVDNVGDIVTETSTLATEIDTVNSSVTYTLSANVERLTLTGTANINGIGNALNNSITGNASNNILLGGAGNDILNGGAGTDSMTGGTDNDTYYIDNAGDTITELTGEGIDTVFSTIDYTLVGTYLENLTLQGTAINGTGNEFNNSITGNASNNVLVGGDGNDVLNGATGADSLTGGTGSDTYTVDNVDDIVTETSTLTTEIDTVNSSVTYTLSANVEKLTLTGTTNIDGTGNTLANTLTGNSGNNILDGGDGNDSLNGGTGIDTLIGGLGNDTYTVDNVGDIVTETSTLATEIDTVNSSVTYTLSANVERLTLTGTANIDGTGNTLANTITGNSGNNILTGNGSNDLLTGNGGSDVLVGGTGNDTLNLGLNDGVSDIVRYASGDGIDTINQFIKETDKLAFTGIGFIDVKVSDTSTQLRLSDGIQANANFGTGTLLAIISGVTGFTATELGLGGTSLDPSNTATFLFA